MYIHTYIHIHISREVVVVYDGLRTLKPLAATRGLFGRPQHKAWLFSHVFVLSVYRVAGVCQEGQTVGLS